jgi:hypothetical protein
MECHGKTFLLWKQRADGCESTLNFFQTHFEDMLRLPCNPVSWEELLGLFYQRKPKAPWIFGTVRTAGSLLRNHDSY